MLAGSEEGLLELSWFIFTPINTWICCEENNTVQQNILLEVGAYSQISCPIFNAEFEVVVVVVVVVV